MLAITCAWTLTGATEEGQPVEVRLRGRGPLPWPSELQVEGEVLAPFVEEPACRGSVRLGAVVAYAVDGEGWELALRQPLTLAGGPPGFTCVDGSLGPHRVHLRFDPRGGVRDWLKSLALAR